MDDPIERNDGELGYGFGSKSGHHAQRDESLGYVIE
jgi:hypothetical protein